MFDKIESIEKDGGILMVAFKDGTTKCGTSLELKLYKELEKCYAEIADKEKIIADFHQTSTEIKDALREYNEYDGPEDK